MWSHSVCNFSSGLGVLNEDQLLKSASFGESDFTEETFVLQVFYEAMKQSSKHLPHIPNCSLHVNLLMDFSPRLFGHEKRSSPTCSGLQKTSEKTSAAPAQVWKQIQGFTLAFEHSRALLQQVRSQGPPCSRDLKQTTCEMATTSWFYILFYFILYLNRTI